MNERASTTVGWVLTKYLLIFLFTAYLLTYLTGGMEEPPTAKETIDFLVHVFTRLIELIRLIAGAISEG